MTIPRPYDRLTFDVLTVNGSGASLEVRLLPDHVEIWHHGSRAARLERTVIRAWLADPVGDLVNGEMTLTLGRSVDVNGRIEITLPDVRAWSFSPGDYAFLKSRI